MTEIKAPELRPIGSDSRGASWSLYFPDLDAEMVIIYSKANTYRGGHSHINKRETSMLLSGSVSYVKKLTDGQIIEFDEKPGDVLKNDIGEVHRAYFTEPSFLIDWKIDCKVGEAITVNDPELRAKVDEQMKETQNQ